MRSLPDADEPPDRDLARHVASYAVQQASGSGDELDTQARAFIAHVCSRPGGFGTLSRTLRQAYHEGVGIEERLDESRSLLEHTTVDRLHQMHGKLSEVTSATETATTHIMNGLNRGVEIVDRLMAVGDAAPRAELLASLREELYQSMEHLQFQDITAQQIGFVSSLLVEMRARMNHLVSAFAPYALVLTAAPAHDEPQAFDPHATTTVATGRQAAADATLADLAAAAAAASPAPAPAPALR